jgi:hypothetical protein
MGPVRTVAPVLTDSSGVLAYPVSLSELRNYCKVPDYRTGDDPLITSLAKEAYERCEHVCGRALLTSTWRLTLDSFTGGGLTWRHDYGRPFPPYR